MLVCGVAGATLAEPAGIGGSSPPARLDDQFPTNARPGFALNPWHHSNRGCNTALPLAACGNGSCRRVGFRAERQHCPRALARDEDGQKEHIAANNIFVLRLTDSPYSAS